jgi:type VI secretion system protein
MKDRLLKRISRWEQLESIDHDDIDANTFIESIRDDLEKLYNTRRGTVLIDENFGLPDFSHMLNGYAAPDTLAILQQLHLQAKNYEQRLQSLHVKYVEQSKYPGKLQFQVTANVNYKGQDIPFNAFALLSDDGSISLNAR